MKRSERDALVLKAIRQTVRDEEFWPGDLIDRCAGMRAKDNRELDAAIGGQFKNALSLGCWLKKHQGAIVDGHRLSAQMKKSRKGPGPKGCWYYWFDDVNELGEDGIAARKAFENEDRLDTCAPGSIRQCKEFERQVEKIDARIEQKAAEVQLAKESGAFQQMLEGTRKRTVKRVLSDGRIEYETELPPPVPTAPAAPPPSELKPTRSGKCPAHGHYCCGYRLTKGEAAKTHNYVVASGRMTNDDWFINACEARRQRIFNGE